MAATAIILATIIGISSAATDASWSFCARGTSRTVPTLTGGIGPCMPSAGVEPTVGGRRTDVFLKSTIVEVGIHYTGSYGTYRKAPNAGMSISTGGTVGADKAYQGSEYQHGWNPDLYGT